MGRIVVTGLNHRTAPLSLRERFAVDANAADAMLRDLLAVPGVTEAAVLSTCNRVEIYTVEDGPHGVDGPDSSVPPDSGDLEPVKTGHGSTSFLADRFNVKPSEFIDHLYRFHDAGAVRHLFGVAAGLDSMMVGEPQILGQVRAAHARARAAGTVGPVLGALFARAVTAARRARAGTALASLAVSVPFAAVRLARQTLGPLGPVHACLLGRGPMCEATATHLRHAGVGRLTAVNRARPATDDFARRVGAEPAVFSPDLAFLAGCDMLVVGTRSPEGPLVTRAALAAALAGTGRPLLVIDLSVPRQVEPTCATIRGVDLHNVDHLEHAVATDRQARDDEARKAAALLEHDVAAFVDWLAALRVVPTIRAFRDRLESLRADAIQRAFGDYEGWDPAQRKTVEKFSRALVRRLAHTPTVRLKNATGGDAVLRELFDLGVETG